jgi:hypothetical protein
MKKKQNVQHKTWNLSFGPAPSITSSQFSISISEVDLKESWAEIKDFEGFQYWQTFG